jgi:hypothetical protein
LAYKGFQDGLSTRSDTFAVHNTNAADLVCEASIQEAVEAFSRLFLGVSVQIQRGLAWPFVAPQAAQKVWPASMT